MAVRRSRTGGGQGPPGRPAAAPGRRAGDRRPDPAQAELTRILDEELGRLPDRDRDLLVLVYLDGKTHDEAARAVGCPAGSVAWRLDRARAALRKRLARRGVGLAVGAVLLLASFGQAQVVSEVLVRRTAAGPPRPAPAGPRPSHVLLVLALLTLLGGGVYAGFVRDRLAAGGPTAPSHSPATGAAEPAVHGGHACTAE
ncbi:MAG: RNA polymerase sigma factor [Gemmataceae bacterium]